MPAGFHRILLLGAPRRRPIGCDNYKDRCSSASDSVV
jgi:hypothetical protein